MANSKTNFTQFLSQFFLYKETDKYDFTLPPASNDKQTEKKSDQQTQVFNKLSKNLEGAMLAMIHNATSSKECVKEDKEDE